MLLRIRLPDIAQDFTSHMLSLSLLETSRHSRGRIGFAMR
jgi:hypothetical protein